MKTVLYIIFLALFLGACSNNINSDSVKPIIENLSIVDEEGTDINRFTVGTTQKYSARFTDNEQLGSYKFDIHFAGDGHVHPDDITQKKSISLTEWSFTKNDNLDGSDKTITFTKVIDEEAKAGPYHCLVYSTDAAGNVAKYKEKNFIVVRDDMPLVTISEPDFTDLFIVAGSSFIVKGNVEALRGLSKLQYIIRTVSEENVESIVNLGVNQDGTTKVEFSEEILIPEETAPGSYFLRILASDKEGSVSAGEIIKYFEVL